MNTWPDDPPVAAIGVGDFVVFGGRDGDVWVITAVRHGAAKVSPRSIHLAGRPGRTIALSELRRYRVEDGDVF